MTYTIEHGIPMPAPKNGADNRRDRTAPYSPLSTTMMALQVGDSFEVSSRTDHRNVMGRLSNFRPKKFAIRKMGNVWRVWRVE